MGKASNLRRRLWDHARAKPTALGRRWRVLLERVKAVRWEVCVSEESALVREADLIIMLRPAFNASHTGEDAHHYLAVAAGQRELVQFELTTTPVGPGRVYGCFPHLAKGAFSHPATRSKSGFTALLRLLWSSQAGGGAARIPARIAGASPPNSHAIPVAADLRAVLHDYLSGRSARLLNSLRATIAAGEIPEFMRPGLERDIVAAKGFFELGPHRIRRLRLRNGLPPGPVGGDVMAEILAAEVREAIGGFRSTAALPEPATAVLGRRWAARHRRPRESTGDERIIG